MDDIIADLRSLSGEKRDVAAAHIMSSKLIKAPLKYRVKEYICKYLLLIDPVDVWLTFFNDDPTLVPTVINSVISHLKVRGFNRNELSMICFIIGMTQRGLYVQTVRT